MGRVYYTEFHDVTVAAIQDLLAVYASAGIPLEVHGFVIGQITGTTIQNLNISVKRLNATVTPGVSGSSNSLQKKLPNDAGATCTARKNDTTQATSSSTDILHSDVLNTINGIQFFWPEKARPVIGLSGAVVLSLNSAPTSMHMSGTLIVEEMI